MKINSIYISAFGKLKDFSLDLSDGLNVIYGENENGKSTVMAFIKMMFYGSGGRKAQQISANPRIKYLPWDGGTMGGRIMFTHDGKSYCLEREFKKSDSTDRIKLTDVDTRKELPTDGCPGMQFFSIGAEAFERSVFVGSSGASVSSEKAEGELNARLSNLAVTGDEDTSYQTVLTRLNDARFAIISKSGRTGSMVKAKEELHELEEQLAHATEMTQRKNELNRRANELRERYKAIDAEIRRLKVLLEKEKDIKSAEKLSEYLAKKAELDRINLTLTLSDGTLADSMLVKKLDFCLTRLNEESKKLAELEAALAALKEQAELADRLSGEETKQKLDEAQKLLERLKQEKATAEQSEITAKEEYSLARNALDASRTKRKAFNPLMLIAGATLLIVGLVVAFILTPFIVGGAIAAIGAISAILSFIIKPLDTSATFSAEQRLKNADSTCTEISSRITRLQGEISETAGNISLLTAALSNDATAKAKREAEISSLTSQVEESHEKEASATADLNSLCLKLGIECDIKAVSATIPELEKAAQTQKEIKLRLGYLSSDLGGISYETAEEKLKAIKSDDAADTDFDAVKAEHEKLSQQLNDLAGEISSVLTELRTGFSGVSDPVTLKTRINELSEKIEAQNQFYKAVCLAADELNESFAEVRRGYGSALESETLGIFSRLTGGRYTSIGVSKSMDITVKPADIFGTREIDYLSQGTADQAYLSLRLAMAKLISEESLPVFLDDALAQYDDRRTAEALTFLNEFSAERQIVLFTCHNSICEIARQHNTEPITFQRSDT